MRSGDSCGDNRLLGQGDWQYRFDSPLICGTELSIFMGILVIARYKCKPHGEMVRMTCKYKDKLYYVFLVRGNVKLCLCDIICLVNQHDKNHRNDRRRKEFMLHIQRVNAVMIKQLLENVFINRLMRNCKRIRWQRSNNKMSLCHTVQRALLLMSEIDSLGFVCVMARAQE